MKRIKKYAAALVVLAALFGMAACVSTSKNSEENLTKKYRKGKGFVKITAGSFQMGTNNEEYDDKPVHNVTLTRDFYICDHEVTQEEYEAVMGTNPSWFDGTKGKEASAREHQKRRPVEMISWYMALVYCNKRTMAEGFTPCYTINGSTDPADWGDLPGDNDEIWDNVTCDFSANGYRLPTEAEWEYAARAGDTEVNVNTYSGAGRDLNRLRFYCWFRENDGNRTHEVMTTTANAWGLYDMCGNVWEWCWDRWPPSGLYPEGNVTDPTGDSEGNVTDPTGDSEGIIRIRRGGSFGCGSGFCSVTIRGQGLTWRPDNYNGIRVVRTASTRL